MTKIHQLTETKMGLMKEKGYCVTGYVMTNENGDKVILHGGASRELTNAEFLDLIYNPYKADSGYDTMRLVFMAQYGLTVVQQRADACIDIVKHHPSYLPAEHVAYGRTIREAIDTAMNVMIVRK